MAPPRQQDPSEPGSKVGDPGTAREHDEAGRARGTPYAPAGRNEAGEPVPAVPHEAFLGRLAGSVQMGLAVVLAVVAVWAFVAGATVTSSAPVDVLGLRVNGAHACVLAATAVLGGTACWYRGWLRRWALAQSIAYFVIFAFGSGLTVNEPDRYGFGLNGPDHAMHATVAILGFVVAMLSSARIIEPPPSPPAYPVGGTDVAHEDEREREQQR